MESLGLSQKDAQLGRNKGGNLLTQVHLNKWLLKRKCMCSLGCRYAIGDS